MATQSRRNFIKLTMIGTASGVIIPASLSGFKNSMPKVSNRNYLFQLGIASYTFRNYSLEDTLKMTNRLGIKQISLKNMHLPLDKSETEIRTITQQVKNAGINLYGGGVIYMKSKEEVDQAFEYAKMAGLKIIIGAPNHDLLNYVNEKVMNYNIRLAIHNHGPGDDVYPTPQSVYEKIKNLDPRIGLCIDIGHTQRNGIDPSDALLKYSNRIYDMHIRDVTEATKNGQTIEMGRGIIDIPKFIKTVLKTKYSGVLSFEYDINPDDVLPGMAESVGYVHGVLNAIK